MYPHDGSTSLGLGQHIKGTWEQFAHRVDPSLAPLNMRLDPNASIRVTAYMLNTYINRYHSIEKAIYSYNQGSFPTNGTPTKYGLNYVKLVEQQGGFNVGD